MAMEPDGDASLVSRSIDAFWRTGGSISGAKKNR